MRFISSQHLLVFLLVLIVFFGAGFSVGTWWGFEKRVYSEHLANTFNGISEPPSVDLRPLWDAWALVEERYVFEDKPTEQEMLYGAISGVVESIGDPYTTFLPPDDAEIFTDDIQGNFGGVGIEIGIRDEVITVISPLRGTPAAKANIKSGDRIIEVDGKSTVGFSSEDAVKRIRGEKGTEVVLTIFREETGESAGGGRTFDVTLVRDTIEIPTIETSLRDGVFIISLFNFSTQSPQLFEEALREFSRTGDNKLVIDLRGNPGGFLEAAIQMASFFLPEGDVILKENFGGAQEEQVFRSKGYDVFREEPEIVVLVDGGSASASEILAAALQESGMATVVGTKTFGKGSVQELMPLTTDTYIKMTIARWLTPKENSLEENGVTPDIIVELDDEKPGDEQLIKALEILQAGE